jgi:hypothetical protein
MEKNSLLNSLLTAHDSMPMPSSKHDTVISKDDILNLKIDLGLCIDVSQFITAI